MPKHGKRYRQSYDKVDREKQYSPAEAVRLIKEALRLDKGSGEPNRMKVGRLTRDQVRQIAETKMPDLNARDVEQAMKIIEGTARSMGVEVAV